MIKKYINIKTIIVGIIGAVLFALLGKFMSFPVPKTPFHVLLQYSVLAVISALFGPVSGFLTGMIGMGILKVLHEQVMIGWILASAFYGTAIGLSGLTIGFSSNKFDMKKCLQFHLIQVLANLISFTFVGPVFQIIIYGEEQTIVVPNGFYMSLSNIVVTLLSGTLLMFIASVIINSFLYNSKCR